MQLVDSRVNPIVVPDFQGRRLSMMQAEQNQKLGDAQLKRTELENQSIEVNSQKQQAIMAIFAKTGGKVTPETIEALRQIDPMEAQKAEQALLDSQSQQATFDKTKLDNEAAQLKTFGDKLALGGQLAAMVLNSKNKAAAYKSMLNRMKQAQIDTSMFSPEYSPDMDDEIEEAAQYATPKSPEELRALMQTITTDQGIMQFNPETGRYDINAGATPKKEEVRDPKIGTTIDTAQGIMQWNPETQRYDIKAGDAKQAPTASTPHTITTDKGIFQWNPATQKFDIKAGDAPARVRTELRPVTSGDANKIADFDTSLDDLKTLRTDIPKGATGARAKAGTMLPNVVTEVFGWGGDAKQKQATIDRVKQVIGKALEGGVLRKEDEYKYEKILPTIGDPDQVVKSKLDGLEKAIRERRATLLDALDDGGYDVTRYRQRPEGGKGGITMMVGPDDEVWEVPTANVPMFEQNGYRKQ